MRLSSRLSLSLIIGVASVSFGFAFYQTQAETTGLKDNLQRHSLVLAESLAKSAEPLVEKGSIRDLQRLVDRFLDREQIVGVAVYDTEGRSLAQTAALTQRIGGNPAVILTELEKKVDPTPGTEFLRLGGSLFHVAAITLRDEGTPLGTLAIFHDANYIDMQASGLWRRALTGVTIQTLLIVCITLLTVRMAIGRPLYRMAQWMRELRLGKDTEVPNLTESHELEPLRHEVTRLASSLNAARAAAEEEARLRHLSESQWTQDRLRAFVQEKLGGSRLVVVSNREPYEHRRGNSGIEVAVPASGLVTAIEPILRTCDGTWIAQGSGDADRESVDEFDHVRVPPDHPSYTLRRVWLTEEEEKGYYLGFANEGLWPLCHIAHTRPTFRMEDWAQYEYVNQKFANAVLEEIAGEENPAVLVQDYHFALLPRLIKDARPDARVAIFWHIPWPNPEAFGICPWQREVLHGLLGADLIGFHIQAHCNNFLDTVDRTLECRIEREHFAVTRAGQYTMVRPFPISVSFDATKEMTEESELPHLERVQMLARLGVRASFMGIGVDRVDYTKGLPERFRAIERFFEKYPAYRREFTFVQIGSPSRTLIPRYHDLMAEVTQDVERINRRFQTSDWRPVVYLNRQHSHDEIIPYYRAADVCVVTSLHDGMNLVAKEFVASRDDGQGALILSQFAGASHELADAIVVNPYDTEQLSDAICHALDMPLEERRMRMHRLRSVVRERNVYRWAGELIGQLCEIRTGSSAPAIAPYARQTYTGSAAGVAS